MSANVDVMADLSKTVEAVRDAAVTAYVETRQLKAFVGELIAENEKVKAERDKLLNALHVASGILDPMAELDDIGLVESVLQEIEAAPEVPRG